MKRKQSSCGTHFHFLGPFLILVLGLKFVCEKETRKISRPPALLTNMFEKTNYAKNVTHGYSTCSKYQLSTELHLNSAMIQFYFFVFMCNVSCLAIDSPHSRPHWLQTKGSLQTSLFPQHLPAPPRASRGAPWPDKVCNPLQQTLSLPWSLLPVWHVQRASKEREASRCATHFGCLYLWSGFFWSLPRAHDLWWGVRT